MHTSKLKKQKSNICLLRELGPGVKTKNSCWVPAPLFTLPMILTESQFPCPWNNGSLPCPCGDQVAHVKALLESGNQQKTWAAFIKLSTFCVAYLMTANGQLAKSQLIGKDPDVRKDWGQEEKGATNDEMVGRPHWLSGHEFEQTLGDGEGQGSLACCSPWGQKESDMTEQLNDNNG